MKKETQKKHKMWFQTECTYIGIIPKEDTYFPDYDMCFVAIGGIKGEVVGGLASRVSKKDFKKLRLWKAPIVSEFWTSFESFPLKVWDDLINNNLVRAVNFSDSVKSKVDAIEILEDGFYG